MSKDKTTTHEACNHLIEILLANNINHAVISPGSRNAPLIVAFARCESITKYVIVDERSAAFVALGLAQQLNKAVALVCTSGSAMLNYAPALSEAYYQQIPLIAITADRPIEWIDQDDSQTIRQFEALSKVVKRCYDIPAIYNDDTVKWYINRSINDAIITANGGRKAPVHINFQLKEPLCDERKVDGSSAIRSINQIEADSCLNNIVAKTLCDKILMAKQVLVVASIFTPDDSLINAINHIAERDNVVILTETITNIKGNNIISTIDRTLSAMPKESRADFAPDLLITFGGALVSRMLKQYLRKYKATEHWHVGVKEHIIDTMQSLTTNINVSANSFFPQIDAMLSGGVNIESNYSTIWHDINEKGTVSHNDFVSKIEWCDLKAFSLILPNIPANYNLQLSNGTAIRYAQLFNVPSIRKSNCNRGVAGIDGATSTALGASLASNDCTLFITGDMSFSYDISGLASQYNNPRFKIIVICNGGGGIFRFIKGPSDLPELERYFEVNRDVPVNKYADTFGFDYFEAVDENSLKCTFDSFINNNNRASILAIYTPNEVNARVLRNYFKRNN